MSKQASKKPLIVILGPTAVGKTDLAIKVAQAFNGEIVSADSRLLYRGMDIGTAKPTPEQMKKVPHHLIDVTTPDKVWSLGQYQQEAIRIIDNILLRNKIPFLVGGTGQYIKAVCEGWHIPPVAPDANLRATLEAWAKEIGVQGLYEKLLLLDPDVEHFMDGSNLRRIIRAFEVIYKTGKPFSSMRKKGEAPYQILKIGLTRPRSELYQRIDSRIDEMIAAGFEEEVKTLLAKGYSIENPPLSAIGYKQMILYIRGELTLDEAIRLMRRKTREFVRRQANWFKLNDEEIVWFQMSELVEIEVINTVKLFLDSD